MEANYEVSYDDLNDIGVESKYNIYLRVINTNAEKTYYIYEAELFAQNEGKSIPTEDKYQVSGIVLPDGRVMSKDGKNVSTLIAQAETKTKYFYYEPDESIKEEKNIRYLYVGNQRQDYSPVYDLNFEKVRSISKKESNRFDLLQTLSETFECWCRFDIWHKETGEILLAKDANVLINSGTANTDEKVVFLGGDSYTIEEVLLNSNSNIQNPFQQLKFVTFHKRIGQKKNIGFKYGLNLKSVSRTLDSNDIATKLMCKVINEIFSRWILF